jgi:polysaccharide pyruvyl transferase WcaK-like protein
MVRASALKPLLRRPMGEKFLILGASFRGRGAEAMILQSCKVIRSCDPDSEIFMASHDATYDTRFLAKNGNQYGIGILDLRCNLPHGNRYTSFALKWILALYDIVAVILNSKLLKHLRIKLGHKGKLAKHINSADVIIQIAGIAFTEYFGVINAADLAYQMVISGLMGKRYLCLPQSFGPSDNTCINILARTGLNRVTHVMPRGWQSVAYLSRLKLRNKNVTFAPDLAFSFGNPTQSEIKEVCRQFSIGVAHKYAGVIPNTHLYRWSVHTVDILSGVIDYLTQSLNYKVILMAHEVSDKSEIDDRLINNLIYDNCSSQNDIQNITADLRANDIKSLASVCDFVITARFHGAISCLKMHIPPLVVGWAEKYRELMGLFDLEDLVMDYRTTDKEQVIGKLNYLLVNRPHIIRKIRTNLPGYERTLEIVRDVMEESLKR